MGSPGDAQFGHLCVLVHGFYGGPEHMQNLARCLQDKHGGGLYVLVAKSGSGSLTADGIDRCAERLCAEIEGEVARIEATAGRITRFSVVGHSFGGLVARYAIGLLHAGGFLDTVECRNFTTFATPHLGVRNPNNGVKAFVWNTITSRSLSISSREMFAIDTFRDTGRPVLAVLADRNSIFMAGLRRFQRLSLYSNIAHDRNTEYYTTAIQQTDPFADMEGRAANYLEGYDGVMLDPAEPLKARDETMQRAGYAVAALLVPSRAWLPYIFSAAIAPFYVPLFIVVCPIRSVVESARSSFRISCYERNVVAAGGGISSASKYRAISVLASRGSPGGKELLNASQQGQGHTQTWTEALSLLQPLALDDYQLEMVEGLNTLSWRRHPV